MVQQKNGLHDSPPCLSLTFGTSEGVAEPSSRLACQQEKTKAQARARASRASSGVRPGVESTMTLKLLLFMLRQDRGWASIAAVVLGILLRLGVFTDQLIEETLHDRVVRRHRNQACIANGAASVECYECCIRQARLLGLVCIRHPLGTRGGNVLTGIRNFLEFLGFGGAAQFFERLELFFSYLFGGASQLLCRLLVTTETNGGFE